jgi:hypothetical protein
MCNIKKVLQELTLNKRLLMANLIILHQIHRLYDIKSDKRMIMYNKPERIREDMTVSYFKVLYQNLPGWTKKNHEKSTSRYYIP